MQPWSAAWSWAILISCTHKVKQRSHLTHSRPERALDLRFANTKSQRVENARNHLPRKIKLCPLFDLIHQHNSTHVAEYICSLSYTYLLYIYIYIKTWVCAVVATQAKCGHHLPNRAHETQPTLSVYFAHKTQPIWLMTLHNFCRPSVRRFLKNQHIALDTHIIGSKKWIVSLQTTNCWVNLLSVLKKKCKVSTEDTLCISNA